MNLLIKEINKKMGTTTSRQSSTTRDTIAANRPNFNNNFQIQQDVDGVNCENNNNPFDYVPEENEYPHLGSVHVSLSWLNPNALRSNEQDNSYYITAKGGVCCGTSAPSPIIMNELRDIEMNPTPYTLLDSRAHQLLICHDAATNGWHAISSPEVFSRHTGTCLIIGKKKSCDSWFDGNV